MCYLNDLFTNADERGHGIGRALILAARPATHEDMSVHRRAAQGLAAHPPELHQGIDPALVEPMGAEIDRMALEAARDRTPADAVSRLQHRHSQSAGQKVPRRGDPGASRADDRHVGIGIQAFR